MTYILPKRRDVVVCLYDIDRFSPQVLIDVLETHPLALIGGVLHVNPWFVPPDAYLHRLRGRRAKRPAGDVPGYLCAR